MSRSRQHAARPRPHSRPALPGAASDTRLLEAFASLNQMGAAINRTGPGERVDVAATLRLIAESAIKVVPGALAVIYTCGEATQALDPASRVSAGDGAAPFDSDEPRAGGIGERAIAERRRVLSYEEVAGDGPAGHPAIAPSGATAVACYPLVVAEQVVGALYVYLREAREFAELELLMLDNLVNQAAMAIYHARQLASVRRHLARRDDELARLRHAGLLISSRLRLSETLDAILQMAMQVTNAHYGIFRLVDRKAQNLVARAVAGEGLNRPLLEALPINTTSIMGWVAKHRQPLCVQDLRAEPWARIYYPLDHDLEMRSELAVPLIGASGRLEGVLNLESPQVGAFAEPDSHLLQALATQAVIAIQEARLLDALQDVAGRLLSQTSDQVLSHLVELACDLLDGAASAIWILEGEDLALRAASAGHVRGERIPRHSSLNGLAISRRQPVTSDDVRTDPRFHRPDLARAQGWTRALVVPVEASDEGEPVGAFSVYSVGAGRLAESEWDEKVLTGLAHYAALAVQNDARQAALRAAEEKRAIAETFAAVGDVAANLLHHLNNKVGTIPVRIQGIQDKCLQAIAADPYLETNLREIERSALEAMEAVRENLYHLRPIHLVPVDVAACARAAIASAHLPAAVTLHCAGLEGLPAVTAAERSLALVYANLLENAVDAMEGQGEISLRGSVDGSWVEVAVADTGPGIAPELHGRIFELSYSGRGATRPGKLGFGLWWVKTLMARLGGSVSVESDGQHGATFRIRLPVAGEQQP